jgi:endonuclease G
LCLAGKPPQLVSVPTHYYKVVLAENSSGKHGDHRAAVGAFVMPNAPIDPQTPVTAFAVPLEALESVAGEAVQWSVKEKQYRSNTEAVRTGHD